MKNADEWVPLPGSIGAIAELSRAGFTVAVASNQSGLGSRYCSTATRLRAMHRKLRRLVAAEGGRVDRIVVCPHGPDEQAAVAASLSPDCCGAWPGTTKRHSRMFPLWAIRFATCRQRQRPAQNPFLCCTGNGETTAARLPDNLDSVPIFDDLAAFAATLTRM